MTVTVRTENLWKTYGGGGPHQVDAVRDVTIEIERGEITAIGGPSGSGKTTLLSLVGLLTRPTKGKVLYGDQDFSGLSEVFRTRARRQRIGFIFQAQYLIPQLTAVENVALPMLCLDVPRSEAEKLAAIRLSSLGMNHRLDFRVAELSGGEQQRVSIARSLMNAPEILIADEPNASIDEKSAEELHFVLREMVERNKLTVLLASHDAQVLNWADRRLNMRDGKIVD
ncbi:MAG: lipoprotein-releasing system ATP-binding protein LolD [Candidatus Thorarchaeota archaeon]|nr:MAG: lipoprotein-releasing system ATP-binding protein LolD [Candidatus Thorarchaeota archaeon]